MRGRYRDLKGYRKGELVAVEPAGKDRHGHYLWKVLCRKCGKTKVMSSVQLLDGKPTKDCGCTPSHGYDWAGLDIGTFTVVEHVGLNPRRERLWMCRCRVCGERCVLPTHRLSGGDGRRIAGCPACGAWSPKDAD